MSAKSKRTRKPRNVITLDTSKTSLSVEERWLEEIYNFIEKLNDHEVALMTEMLEIITRKPRKNKASCEIINFAKRDYS